MLQIFPYSIVKTKGYLFFLITTFFYYLGYDDYFLIYAYALLIFKGKFTRNSWPPKPSKYFSVGIFEYILASMLNVPWCVTIHDRVDAKSENAP